MSPHKMNKKGSTSAMPVTNEEKKEKKQGENFFMPIFRFILSFMIGAIVIVIFFAITWLFELRFGSFHFDFWVKAIASLTLAALVLKVGSIVKPGETLLTKAIPFTLMSLFLCLILWHYGYRYSREFGFSDTSKISQTGNPFANKIPTHVFHLERGEKSFWVDFPAGYKMETWGDLNSYKMFYETGETVNVTGEDVVYLPDRPGPNRVKFESLANGQKIYVYLSKL